MKYWATLINSHTCLPFISYSHVVIFYFISIINKIKSIISSFRKLKWKKSYISDIENR